MQKIEILRVISPSDFWIAERDTKSFLDMIHVELKKEKDCSMSNYDEYGKDFYAVISKDGAIFAVYDKQTKMWFRAVAISQISSFSDTQHFNCFLIDRGETILASTSYCSRIYNKNLLTLPPLAKHCTLYGIKPSNSERFAPK